MQVQIQIIKVGKVESKGTYSSVEVTYKNLSQNGKVEGKKLVSFGDYAHVYEAALSWKEDDVITLQNEKVENPKTGKAFWTWVDVIGSDNQPTQEKEVAEKQTQPAATKQQWVPDEIKQRLIVRQSCLAQAQQWETHNAGSVEDVLTTAQRFVDWVYNVETPSVAEPKKVGRPKKIETPDQEVD